MKVYCKDCEYHYNSESAFCVFSKASGGRTHVTSHESIYISDRNKDNNCEFYRKKRKWWKFWIRED